MSEFAGLRKHEKTQHALKGLGSAALAAAVRRPSFPQRIIMYLTKKMLTVCVTCSAPERRATRRRVIMPFSLLSQSHADILHKDFILAWHAYCQLPSHRGFVHRRRERVHSCCVKLIVDGQFRETKLISEQVRNTSIKKETICTHQSGLQHDYSIQTSDWKKYCIVR